MKEIENVTVGTIEEYFAELVPKLGVQRTPIYRGQKDYDWTLLPGLLREDLARAEFGNWASLEATQMMKFKQRSTDLLNCQPQSELEWRAQGTQRGLPTTLSSWTENGMVALFYATEQKEDESDGVVWRIVPGDSRMEISQDHEQLSESSSVYFPRHRDREMENQRVCYVTHPLPDRGQDPVPFEEQFCSGNARMHLSKIRIPHSEKETMRAKLATIGIDTRMISPGLQGLCAQIQEEIYTHTNSYNWIVETS